MVQETQCRFRVQGHGLVWVLVRGFNFSYHNKETIVFSIDPYYGNLSKILYQEPSSLLSVPCLEGKNSLGI